MNAVIYARFSSQNQTEQSIKEQIKVCEEYSKEKGYTITDTHIDTDNRKQFEQMVKDSSKKKFQAVIVYSMDRFARNRFDFENYKYKLKQNGVSVLFAKEKISDDASGILLESILESLMKYYSQEHSQKIKEGIARKKKDKERLLNEG